jgi:chromosome segregation ATPase
MTYLPVADRLRFERMIEQGIDLGLLEAQRVDQNLQGFQQNAVRVDGMVLERLDEARAVIADLDGDLEAMPFLDAEQLECDALMRALVPLEEAQEGLCDKLDQGERELHILQKNTELLRATAQKLNQSLHAAKGRYSFESPFYNAGSMVCMSAAKPINK